MSNNSSDVLDRVYHCPCGHKIRISEFQLGMEITCPMCKTEVVLRESNTERLERYEAPKPRTSRPTGFAMEEGEVVMGAGAAAENADACSRCGKPFRGDWDKHKTLMGDVCNFCANLAMEGGPETLKLASEPAATETPAYNPFNDPTKALPPAAPDEPDEPWKPRWMEEHPQAARAMLWALAIGLILTALWATTVEPPEPSATSEGAIAAAQESMEALNKIPFYVSLVVYYGFSFLHVVLPLYLVLRFTDKLPFDAWWSNAIEVCFVGLVMGLIVTATGFVPFVGGLIGGLITLYYVWDRYDLSIFELFLYIIIGMVCGALLWAAKFMVLGAVAHAIL